MRGTVLEEPELEFGDQGRHIDPRFGITSFGPLDVGSSSAPERIRVGIVGWPAAVEGIRNWLGRAREPLAAKPAKYPRQSNMFPPFPGFDSDHGFRALLTLDDRNLRAIPPRVIDAISRRSPLDAVRFVVDTYLEEIAWLAESDRCDVIICARPDELDAIGTLGDVNVDEEETPSADGKTTTVRPDFHDQLKAGALPYSQPLQIMRPATWGERANPPKGVRRRGVQDEATRAWNLHTALYYKAGGTPWRLVRSYADTTTCYLGVSFYKSADGALVHTSVAQLFNEKGEGVVVRGGPAAILKDDRQPHLSEEDAHDLVKDALSAYRREHKTFPARLVLHKTSRFTDVERSGFTAAAEAAQIEMVELIWLSERDPTRLVRSGEHPPLRGTMVSLADDRHILYTRGSVDFYGTYPGMYIPAPLAIRPVDVHHQPEQLAAETLSLTKLNWNHSQLDGHLPITLHAANKVKAILRHAPEGAAIAKRYAHYM